MKLRGDLSLIYFDRTNSILSIEKLGALALLFLRLRRFGKSLIVSMIEYFHGLQYRKYYKMLFKVC
jgi:hypothetical protein